MHLGRLIRWFAMLPFTALLSPAAAAGEPCCAAVDFQALDAQDVQVQLVEVKRTGANEITVAWQYINKNKAPQQLAQGGQGWSDGYRLAWEAEVLDLATRTRYRVAQDQERRPVAAKHEVGTGRKGISVGGNRTLKTWAKFLVPSSVTRVTVTIPGAAMPWENVPILSAEPVGKPQIRSAEPVGKPDQAEPEHN